MRPGHGGQYNVKLAVGRVDKNRDKEGDALAHPSLGVHWRLRSELRSELTYIGRSIERWLRSALEYVTEWI